MALKLRYFEKIGSTSSYNCFVQIRSQIEFSNDQCETVKLLENQQTFGNAIEFGEEKNKMKK